jgi:hypothetical protein
VLQDVADNELESSKAVTRTMQHQHNYGHCYFLSARLFHKAYHSTILCRASHHYTTDKHDDANPRWYSRSGILAPTPITLGGALGS